VILAHSNDTKLASSIDPTDHVRGPDTAIVTVVEYGDFECSACGRAYGGVKTMLRRFRSDMRHVYRHFPQREVHFHAEMAAEAAEVAAAQGKFWEMHDRLFENQLHLKEKSLRTYADEIELDLDRFDYELREHVYLQRIQEHIDSGHRYEVRGTPTFFVNGELVDVSFGILPLEEAIVRCLGIQHGRLRSK